MSNKSIYIYSNKTELSQKIESKLKNKLINTGLHFYNELTSDTDLIICIGGDGTLLRLVQEKNFPSVPIVGINTGHLGFFQEILPEKIDDFLFHFTTGDYRVQPYNTVSAEIVTANGTSYRTALNEFAVRSPGNSSIHLNLAINDSFIERFSGDGILVATPAGSTAYNYSLGGSLVDPRLKLLQVTPMAPMNTVAYRSLTSSILIPATDTITIIPCTPNDSRLELTFDGNAETYTDIEQINFNLSEKVVNLVRSTHGTFWDKVKEKFL